MPKVSVVIPNYNHAPFLKRRLDSILNQTYTDFEIIVLDDCSTDNSKDVLLSYKNHPKVSQIIINEQNGGSPFLQWSKGFQFAKGEYIWIAESDDWCEPTFLETLVTPLLEDKCLVLAFCQSLLINEEGNIIYKTENHFIEEKIDGHTFVVSRMFGDTILVNASMALFRKDVLQNIEKDYVKMKNAGDWLFWVSISLCGNVFISGKYLNYFFRHSATVSSKAEISGLDLLEGNFIFQWILQRTNPSLSEIKNAIHQRINIFYQQRKNYSEKKLQKKLLKMILKLHPSAKGIYYKRKLKNIVKTVSGYLN